MDSAKCINDYCSSHGGPTASKAVQDFLQSPSYKSISVEPVAGLTQLPMLILGLLPQIIEIVSSGASLQAINFAVIALATHSEILPLLTAHFDDVWALVTFVVPKAKASCSC